MATEFYKKRFGKKKIGDLGLLAGFGVLIAFFLFGRKK